NASHGHIGPRRRHPFPSGRFHRPRTGEKTRNPPARKPARIQGTRNHPGAPADHLPPRPTRPRPAAATQNRKITAATATGYTDVGARKYDPTLGSFISVDPVFEAANPRELGGYTYAGDNPLANSDPTGLRRICGSE
ncbi:RHS repeat-associated core domain-containing protein, partial [Streptomyces sp. NPDC020192]|uniref:RHS repeat-associated core domain-containing protein n=1 Tax=Streptomyces sp. NPDC020192 TaxID=3365066 RepID=UPI003792C8A4